MILVIFRDGNAKKGIELDVYYGNGVLVDCKNINIGVQVLITKYSRNHTAYGVWRDVHLIFALFYFLILTAIIQLFLPFIRTNQHVSSVQVRFVRRCNILPIYEQGFLRSLLLKWDRILPEAITIKLRQ